jgi:hypothetical protein
MLAGLHFILIHEYMTIMTKAEYIEWTHVFHDKLRRYYEGNKATKLKLYPSIEEIGRAMTLYEMRCAMQGHPI